MDNTFSQPSLGLPTIPDDFEAKAGSSKTDFAKAMFALLATATVNGINATGPEPYDLASLTNQVKELQDKVQNVPLIRQVSKPGVSNANLTVDFEDVGTTDYIVTVAAVTPDGDINTCTWSIIDGSQKSNQVIVRIDGTGATYNFIVSIVTNPS